jgi:hypothetical protein
MQIPIEAPELLLKKLSTRTVPIEGKIKKYTLENNIFCSYIDKKIDTKPIIYEGLSLINTDSFYILYRSSIESYSLYEKRILIYKSEKENSYTHFVDKNYTNYEIGEDFVYTILKNYEYNSLEINKHIVVTVVETSSNRRTAQQSFNNFTDWLEKNNYTFVVEKSSRSTGMSFEAYIPIRIIRLFNAF